MSSLHEYYLESAAETHIENCQYCLQHVDLDPRDCPLFQREMEEWEAKAEDLEWYEEDEKEL